MPSPVLTSMELAQLLELDAINLVMMVVEHWSERRGIFRVAKSERIKCYILDVSIGRWMYGDRCVRRGDRRHSLLKELWTVSLAERRLDGDRVCDPSKSRLWSPPVPLRTPRARCRRGRALHKSSPAMRPRAPRTPAHRSSRY